MIQTVETLYSTIYYSKYFILISLHNMLLPFELAKETPYLTLLGELWSVFYEYFNRNWLCFYKGFLLYLQAWASVCPAHFHNVPAARPCVLVSIYRG